jgi:hypothetical protein
MAQASNLEQRQVLRSLLLGALACLQLLLGVLQCKQKEIEAGAKGTGFWRVRSCFDAELLGADVWYSSRFIGSFVRFVMSRVWESRGQDRAYLDCMGRIRSEL